MNVKEIREKLIKFDDYTEVLTTCRHCGYGFTGDIAFNVVDHTNQTFGYINVELNGRKNKTIMLDREVEINKKDLTIIINELNDFGSCDLSQSDKIDKVLEILNKLISQEEMQIYEKEIRITEIKEKMVEYKSCKNGLTEEQQKDIDSNIEELEKERVELELELYEIYRELNDKRHKEKYGK